MSANFKSSLDGTKAIIGVGGGDQLELNQSGKLTVTGSGQFNGNVTVYGDLSATGNSYFANTFYSTTSALSVINVGNTGPAFYVGNNGTGDIASFYDLDAGVEVLHVGGSNGTFPNVGIKTSTPGETLTVNGTVSASGLIYSQGRALKPLSGVGGIVVNNNSTNVTVISADSSVSSGITFMTEVTATGSTSSIEILNIPSSVKRITVTFIDLSLQTGYALLCLGTASDFVTTGYRSKMSSYGTGVQQDGFLISVPTTSDGMSTLCKSISNKWFSFGTTFNTGGIGIHTYAGSLLSFTGELNRLQIKSSNGGLITSGIVSVSYEF